MFNKEKIHLSVIIVNYNAFNITCRCLSSLIKTSSELNLQIILIDNASKANNVQLIQDLFPQIYIIENKVNQGFAKACNQGFRVAKGDYILLLNPDTIVLPKAVQYSLDFIKNDNHIGILGCKLLNPDKTLQYSCSNFLGIRNILSVNLFLYRIFPGSRIFGHNPYMTYFDYDKVGSVDVVMGAFMMIRQKMLERIGYFDERFFVYSEENDFCLRARQAGWDVVFFPKAEILHQQGAVSSSISGQSYLMLHESLNLYANKHFNGFKKMLIAIILLSGVIIRWFIWQIVRLLRLQRFDNINSKLEIYKRTIIWYFSTDKKKHQLIYENLDR